jgi:hypothetical protein
MTARVAAEADVVAALPGSPWFGYRLTRCSASKSAPDSRLDKADADDDND